MKLKRQLKTKQTCKVKPKTKTTENQKASVATINEGDTSVQQVVIQQQATKIINLSDQSLTECQIELLNNTKSSMRHANASSLPYTQNISRCKNLKEPLFKVYIKSTLNSKLYEIDMGY